MACDDALGLGELLGLVDGINGDQFSFAKIESGETATFIGASSNNDVIETLRKPRDLQFQIELVRPKPRNGGVWLPPATYCRRSMTGADD